MNSPRPCTLLVVALLIAGQAGCGRQPMEAIRERDATTPRPSQLAPASPTPQQRADTDPLAEFFTEQDALEQQDSAQKVIELRILANKEIVVNRRGNLGLNEFKPRLKKAIAEYQKRGVEPGEILVRMSVEKKASCGSLDQLIADCRGNQIEHYLLQLEADYLLPEAPALREGPPPIDVRFSLKPPGEEPTGDEPLPPVHVRLRSNADGSLAGIQWGQQPIRRTEDLRIQAMQLKQVSGESPGLIVEFDTDDELLFQHLAEAVLAVSVMYVPDERGFIPLIESVVPTRIYEADQVEIEDFSLSPPAEADRDPTSVPPLDGVNIDNVRNPFLPPPDSHSNPRKP